MDQEPLVVELIDAGWKFVLDFHHFKQVDVAFWAQSNVDGRWRLYIASKEIFGSSMHGDYRHVHQIAGHATDYFLNPLDVTLIEAGHPAAQTALEVLETCPIRFGGGVNVGVSSDRIRFQLYGIDRVYIYKPIVLVPST